MKISTFSSLRNRNFLIFFSGTLLSHIGDFMQIMAQNWLVLELTNSAFHLGLVNFASAGPRLLVGVFAGVIADRYDKEKVVLVTQSLAMAQAFLFAGLVYAGVIRFWQIILLVIFLGVVNSLAQAARQAFTPELVPKRDLMNAISLNSASVSLTRVLGPSLGGVLIGIVGVAGVLFINGLTFVAILASLLALKLDERVRSSGPWQFGQDLKEGLQYIFTTKRIYVPILLAYVGAMFGMSYSTLVPVFARDILKIGPTGYGALMAVSGVGAVLGILAIASVGEFPHRRRVVFASLALFGICLLIFSQSKQTSLSFFIIFVGGAAQIGFRSTAQTMVQEETPAPLQGRVMGVFFLDFGMVSLGALILGTMAHLVSAPFAVAMAGGVLIIFPAFLYFHLLGRRRKAERMTQGDPPPPG